MKTIYNSKSKEECVSLDALENSSTLFFPGHHDGVTKKTSRHFFLYSCRAMLRLLCVYRRSPDIRRESDRIVKQPRFFVYADFPGAGSARRGS